MSVAIGIDLGGTKIAAGLVQLETGRVISRKLMPTGKNCQPQTILTLATELRTEGLHTNHEPKSLGLAIAELVTPDGQIASAATFDWPQGSVETLLGELLPMRIEADVRAAAFAEATFGAGANCESFLYVTVGTGISCCLVIDGKPWTGARGCAGTFASAPGLFPTKEGPLSAAPPLEEFCGGPAIARRYNAQTGATLSTPEILGLAERGDSAAVRVVESAALALGAAMAQLVNTLDPEKVVLGGGLGLTEGFFRSALEKSFRSHLWAKLHADIKIESASLGPDAGLIGAALVSALQH
jgi:glucokinase